MNTEYKCVTTVEGIRGYIGASRLVAFDFETAPDGPYREEEKAALDSAKAHIVGCSFSVKEGTGIYVPIDHRVGVNIDHGAFFAFLAAFLTDRAVIKVAHNIAFESSFAYASGIVIQAPVYDTICASHIWTLDSKGELLITIMSSLAQEESRSISENVTWGHRKRFADGKVSFAYSRFMGLDKDKETGKIVVNPEQAEVVRLIFRLFLEGRTPHSIASELTRRGIKTPGGKDVWNQQTVRRMLSNEKYKGDALLQKEFTVDFLQKKMKKNEGEVPQYYVEGNHEAIIDPAVFDMVQAELAKRSRGGSRYSGVSIFSNKIKCSDCGGWYGSKVWHSTDRYRKIVYRCNRKYNNEKCQTPHVTEEEVKKAFVSAYNQLVTEKREIITNTELIRKTLCATDALREEKKRLEEEITVLVEMTQSIINENALVAQNQDEYQKRYDGLVRRYDEAKARYDEVVAAISEKEAKGEQLAGFIRTLRSQEGVLKDFDSSLWGSMVDFVTVGRDKKMTVTFRDGSEILA